MSQERIAREVVIHGHVQGVFFRDTLRREADRRGITGWVTNEPDGTVHAVLEGAATSVDEVIAFCHRGPRGARVERVVVHGRGPSQATDFQVR